MARGELREDPAFFEGKDGAGQPIAKSPVEATPEVLARGADRYNIYCAPCHDRRGDGKGILAQRASVPTTSMHDPKVLNAPDGHIYEARMRDALRGLHRVSPTLKFLGSYPRADHENTEVDAIHSDASFDSAHEWVESLFPNGRPAQLQRH